MKIKSLAFILFMGVVYSGYSQSNVIKTNLWSDIFNKNFNIGYERSLNENMSGLLNVNFMPAGQPMPLKTIINISDATGLDALKISGFAFAPEFRIYTSGKKEGPRGFYFAPYLKYFSYKSTYSFDLDYDVSGTPQTETLALTGKLSGFGGGFQIGWQWLIKDKVAIDWWLFGPAFYSAKPSLTFDVPSAVPQSEVNAINDEISGGLEDAPGNFTSTVDGYKITVAGKVPFPALRTGFSIGYAF